jgi:hypothetical protein
LARYIYEMALMLSIFDASASELAMKCLATADGESHFDEVDIPTTARSMFRGIAPFELSAHYPSSRIQFTRIPAHVGEVSWHKVPERVLTVRLNGSAEYQTSDGETRYVPAGAFVLLKDGPHLPSAARETGRHLDHAARGPRSAIRLIFDQGSLQLNMHREFAL